MYVFIALLEGYEVAIGDGSDEGGGVAELGRVSSLFSETHVARFAFVLLLLIALRLHHRLVFQFQFRLLLTGLATCSRPSQHLQDLACQRAFAEHLESFFGVLRNFDVVLLLYHLNAAIY